MQVAAYQAPLGATQSPTEILGLIREQIATCESKGVEILCCPEAVIGGLADYAEQPDQFAIKVESEQLQTLLEPLASDKVATIIGFTEIHKVGSLYNSAAVFYRGQISGIYRKVHPAINKSVYSAGAETPTFRVGDLTFGIIICNDSNFPEMARKMAAQGAKAVFIPTNNGLPLNRTGLDLINLAKEVDTALATENGVYIIRADVAGGTSTLVADGSTEIVAPDGQILASAPLLESGLIIAEINITPDSIAGDTP